MVWGTEFGGRRGGLVAEPVGIADETIAQVRAFQQVVEAVLEEDFEFDAYVNLLLRQGMDSMLADLLGPVDASVLIKSFQQLGATHPDVLYGFIARTLRAGELAEAQAKVRRQMGFRPQHRDANPS